MTTLGRPTGPATGRLEALDGLRGLALLGMLAWHAQIGWVKGGFARMTIFFVLAGFLAARTQLNLRDAGTRRPTLVFWGRRARRLFPITILGVAAAVGATWWVGGSVARSQAFGDAASVLGSFSNWRFIVADRPYGALFEQPSAFQHYWSLSVEEQCFLALPLVLAAAFAVSRRGSDRWRTHAPLVAVAAAALILVALPAVVDMSPDTAYYGTHVRGGEFLAGVALAMWWHRRPSPTPAAMRWWGACGITGLSILVLTMLTLDREMAWLYRGGMGLFAIPAAAVIGGILAGARLVNGALRFPLLPQLGRWAFPIYVLHWPLFQVLDELLPTWPRTPLVLLELGASIALGALVHLLIERPLMPGANNSVVRAWRRPTWALPGAVALGAVALTAAAGVPQRAAEVDFEVAVADASITRPMSTEEAQAILAGPPAIEPTGAPEATTEVTDPGPVRFAFYGGSTALSLALEGGRLAAEDPRVFPLPGYSPLGCGLLTDGRFRDSSRGRVRFAPQRVSEECEEPVLRWQANAALFDVDVAAIAASSLDLTEWQLPGDSTWRSVIDPLVRGTLTDRMKAAVDGLRAGGVATVVLLTPVDPARNLPGEERQRRLDRSAVYRTVMDTVVAATGATIVDIGSWSASLDDNTHLLWFPDGIHASTEGSIEFLRRLMTPALVAAGG